MRSPLVAAAVAVATACVLAFGIPLAALSVRLAGSAAVPALAVILAVAVLLIGVAAYLGRRLGLRYVEAAAEHVDAERELAADLSHRLRTPLTALRLDADSLPDGPARARMRAAIEALDSEIDAIITAARTPVTERAAQATDLVEVVADRLAFWAVLAEDHGRPWEVVGGDEPVYVDVPAPELIGAVDALIGNVFQHTAQGTAFRLTVGPAGLVVDDAGDGIADVPAALRRGASGAGSTGLGLDIVRRVASLAGGSLAIARSDLGGARVTLSLPPR